MTRVYDSAFTCTQDREHLIVDALEKNQPVNFDFLGTVFSNAISPGPRSPERRADKFSFFGEITAEQMRTYSPTQLAIILEQRDNLLGVISKQHQASSTTQQLYYPSGSYRGSLLKPPSGFIDTKPWVPRGEDEECQAKYCHHCRPSCELRSYLSLDGILNGEVPPTAATGFGFHRMRTRPIVNARIVREIGLRPVPWPRAEPYIYPSSPSSQSTLTLSDIIEDHILEPDYVDPEPCLELGEGSTIDSVISTPSQVSAFEQPRLAFTPPSTPTSWTGMAQQGNEGRFHHDSLDAVDEHNFTVETMLATYSLVGDAVYSVRLFAIYFCLISQATEMPPIPCANPPSAAKLFVQLYARRSASSSLAAIHGSSSILDVLLPPRTQGRAFYVSAARNNAPRTIATPIASRIGASTNAHRQAVVGRMVFSTSRPLAKTLAVHNPQIDDDGNDMALEITPRAAHRLSQIMSKDKNPYLALRIQVESGGCHGFQYLMSLTTLPSTPGSRLEPEQVAEDVTPSTTTSSTPSTPVLNEDDTIFAFSPDGVESAPLTSPKIIMDLPSLELLKGSKVDYTMELIGSQFKIVDNPLATSSCGCGTSFDIKV
ncbi:hypothetical protein E0Z10_g656 [Xylaria hypoxylon]|uniref:FeS cluster biogenesis domain-containing protein n=1 Tax=Xylaria hypoxylon TaxID=37992 RepID=A0A4Z0ZEL1_9PEZI|nr:hypothetical protein E0Z10_g656 [Xylaria hypoxylon]